LARLQKDVTLQRVQQATKSVGQAVSTDSASTPEDVVANILERVRIMRVFDFDGVVEAIGEVREELEKVVREPAGLPCPHPAFSPEKRRPREEVADSEDEDGGLDNEEEDMLYGGVSKPEVLQTAPGTSRLGIEDSESKEVAENEGGKISIIVIDNLTQVLNPLLKSNYVQGPHIPSLLRVNSIQMGYHYLTPISAAHALLTTFLRSLADLTHSRSLVTILLNSAFSPRRLPNPFAPPSEHHPNPLPSHQGSDHPSIFASNLAYPALGRTFTYFLDLHLLLSKLPRRRGDARIYYSNQNADHAKGQRDVEMVNVIEVLSDRWEGRVGQWGAFAFLGGGGAEVEGVV
jgi:hypothetical protein